MCPQGYHHSGSMATPALGTRDVRFIYIYIYICNFHTKMDNLTQGSLGQAASSEDFSASEFYYTVHVHT